MNLIRLRPRCWLALLASALFSTAQAAPPLIIGISAEYTMKNSLAAQSIEKGVKLAIEEINAAGGVLGGRKLALQALDDRGVPARAIDNLKQLANNPDALGVFCGRFSPVALELVPVANRERFLLLDPWAAADGIADNGAKPNYVFRLSMTDTWALRVMTQHALERKFKHLALFLPNTGWGRSSLAAYEAYAKQYPALRSQNYWYNWGDTDFTAKLLEAHLKGAEAILMIANETEGAMIVQQMAAQPAQARLPLIAHWGISAGDFPAVAGDALWAVDLVVVQTFSFHDARNAKAQSVAKAYRKLYAEDIENLKATAGFAHAYDLTHLLALAIKKAGSAKRETVRDAMEQLGGYSGLLKDYAKPFSPQSHEALDQNQVFLARYQKDGSLSKAQRK